MDKTIATPNMQGHGVFVCVKLTNFNKITCMQLFYGWIMLGLIMIEAFRIDKRKQ